MYLSAPHHSQCISFNEDTAMHYDNALRMAKSISKPSASSGALQSHRKKLINYQPISIHHPATPQKKGQPIRQTLPHPPHLPPYLAKPSTLNPLVPSVSKTSSPTRPKSAPSPVTISTTPNALIRTSPPAVRAARSAWRKSFLERTSLLQTPWYALSGE